jgi:hypothetical protein
MIKSNSCDPEINVFNDNDLLCYCFHYTKNQIEEDFLINGRSMILEKIIQEKKIGGCYCTKKNPKGH